MRGISDLLDSDMEDSQAYFDENSILSSASDLTTVDTNNEKSAAAKKGKKRHRVTMPKPKTRVTKASPAPATKTTSKKATGAKRKALEEHVNQTIPENRVEVSDEEKQVPTAIKPKARGRAPNKQKNMAAAAAEPDILAEDEEMDIDEEEVEARSAHAPNRSTKAVPKIVSKNATAAKTKSIKQDVKSSAAEPKSLAQVDSDLEEPEGVNEKPKPATKVRDTSRLRQEPSVRRRAGSASDTERGDPNLRRKLGDVTRKFENIDLKYRNLKEIGINEANANMEKLRKQCESQTQAANELIASLKKEIANQGPLAQEARKLKKQIEARDAETEQLKSVSNELAASLAAAQNEVKALQAKLAAARASSVEPVNTRTPGSALKTSNAPRTIMVGSAEAAQAAQIAQMKEDLYSDLTGLIIRSVKRTEEGDTYDCIQTGRNGTLHFKLYLDHEDAKSASFEETEFLYTPLLDANRDRDMIELMPTYLTEDITFARQNAAKFYGRVVDTLTKRRIDE